MKTQISRSSFRPAQHYSGVQLQQGRMIVDADWNEQSDILDQRLVAALGDLLLSGAPKRGGLALKIDAAQLLALPGRLYVEGVAATLDGPVAGLALTAQPDYPNPPALPAGNLRVYADLWERSVTALEDPELMDPGLHGADTASRTRTMLQLKWCDPATDPNATTTNPRIGTAPLSLRLRSVAQAGDLCDPCAAEVNIDERVGNYLFRVEVHDVYVQAGKPRIVLKWSRDNGAEAYATTAIPPGFDQGSWIWEFFDAATEKQLGNHFPATFRPRRGILSETFQPPAAATAPKAFVRRWDGYAEIELTGPTLVGGRDRGAALRTDGDAQAAGRVVFAAGAVTINAELLELTLGLAGKAFVAGDYWLAAVREAVHRSGDPIAGKVLDQALPSGVLHHCLELGRREAGVLLPPAGLSADALRRRMSFPPLTALEAGDVAYQPPPTCLGLYKADATGPVENVRQALDRLCGLGADQVGFTLANPLPANSVASLLAAQLGAVWPNLDGVEKNPAVADMLQALLYRANAAALPYTVPACAGTPGTVANLLGLAAGPGQVGATLDRLLCNLGADQLPLGTPSCPDLAASGATTVLDALDYLCGTRLTRCSVTVPLGALQAQLQDFASRPELTDLWLCLLPGEHTIDGLTITGKRGLRITAAAAAATTIFFRNTPATFSAQELGLEGVRLRFASSARLTLQGNRIVAERNVFVRASAIERLPPMVRVEALGAGSELVWRDNVMQDTWSRRSSQEPGFFGPAVIGNARVARAFEDLLGDTSLVEDDARFESRLKVVADELAGMSGTERLQWRNRLAAARGAAAPRALAAAGTLRLDRPLITALEGSSVGLQSKVRVGALTVDEARPIASTAIDHINAVGNDSAAIAAIVRDELSVLLFESGYNTAFGLAATDLSGSVTDNHFDGEVLLANGQADGVDPRDPPLENFLVSDELPFVAGRGRLACTGNRIQRLYMWVPRAQVNGNLVGGTVPGYDSVTLSANHFGDRGNSVFAATLIVTGNHVAESGVDTTTRLGLTLSQRTSYTGNVAASSGTGAPNWRAIARVRAITGNLMNVIL